MTITTNELRFDTRKNKAGTRTFGECTAWVNFDGTGTVSIRDSLNISSVIEDGLGKYTLNFEQPMDNANYALACATSSDVNYGDPGAPGMDNERGAPSINGFYLQVTNVNNGTYQDRKYVFVEIFGGVA